jgi:hypothetical protein
MVLVRTNVGGSLVKIVCQDSGGDIRLYLGQERLKCGGLDKAGIVYELAIPADSGNRLASSCNRGQIGGGGGTTGARRYGPWGG